MIERRVRALLDCEMGGACVGRRGEAGSAGAGVRGTLLLLTRLPKSMLFDEDEGRLLLLLLAASRLTRENCRGDGV